MPRVSCAMGWPSSSRPDWFFLDRFHPRPDAGRPEAARLTVGLCHLSTGNCITSTRPSDTDTMRVAEHAYDKSYVRMFLTFEGANVSVEFASGSGDSSGDLQLALTPVNCNGASGIEAGAGVNCSDFAVVFMAGFAWDRAGKTASDTDSLSFAASGLRDVTLFTTSVNNPNATKNRGAMAFVLGAGGGLSTAHKAPSFAEITANMTVARSKVLAQHDKYGVLAEVAQAVQVGVGRIDV